MNGVPFYRLMWFVIDKHYRSHGIGGYALEKAIQMICNEFGLRPIALGVHKENIGTERFYVRHGFHKTAAMEGNDYYYLRYPNENEIYKSGGIVLHLLDGAALVVISNLRPFPAPGSWWSDRRLQRVRSTESRRDRCSRFPRPTLRDAPRRT